MEQAEWHAKVEKYFALLHPDFDTLSVEKQFDVLDDKIFIFKNTEAIHEAFSEFSSPGYMENASEQERVQKAIEEVKERNSKKITPTTAVKSALEGTTAIEAAEANGVEQSKLNPEITKEGEKIDD